MTPMARSGFRSKQFESDTGVVAGLVSATSKFDAQRKNNRGGGWRGGTN
jgi:hypothetical protein